MAKNKKTSSPKEYSLTAEDRLRAVQFIEDMRTLNYQTSEKSQLISIKIPENLLRSFRFQCEKKGLKYQTQIKQLMWEWLQTTK